MHPILILLIFLLSLLGVWIFRTRKSRQSKDNIKWIAIIATVILVILAASGRVPWLSAVIAGLVATARSAFPLLLRYLPFIQQQIMQNKQKQQFHKAGQSRDNGQTQENISTVATSILEMELNHDTGEMKGRVLSGSFANTMLEQLNIEQCMQLHQFCDSTDHQSTELLEAYLERRYGEEWQNHHQHQQQQANNQSISSGNMSTAEAFEVLGLSAQASKEEIVTAHRKLMQKLHPDRGGSTYLATKLNQAKDCLLG